MATVKNWISNINKNKLKEFFEENFFTRVGYFSPEYDEEYGLTYLCHSEHSLAETTGVEGHSVQIGNFGVVKTEDNASVDARIVDDFTMAKLNYRAFRDYVLFVAKNNMVNGEPITIGGLNYQEALNLEFNQFIDKLPNKSRFFANIDKKEEIDKQKKMYMSLLSRINEDLNIIYEKEVEPNQE